MEIHALGGSRFGVRIMAGAAPQAISARSLAGALLQLFEMAVGAHDGRAGTGPDEEGEIVRQQFSGPVGPVISASTGNPRRPGQMTLRANALAPGCVELRRVDDPVWRC